jgi:hypothetical protein
MLRWFLRRQVAAFERTWNYDASYLRALIDADPKAMLNPVQFETRSPEHYRWERLPRMVPLARETELRFPNWTRFNVRVAP